MCKRVLQDPRTRVLSFFDLMPSTRLGDGSGGPAFSVDKPIFPEVNMFGVSHWKLDESALEADTKLIARVRFFNSDDVKLVEEHPVPMYAFQRTNTTLTIAIYIARFPFSGFGNYRFNVELYDKEEKISSQAIDTSFRFEKP